MALCRSGNRYGLDLKLEDSLAAALVDQNPTGAKTAMGGTSESFMDRSCSKLPDLAVSDVVRSQ